MVLLDSREAIEAEEEDREKEVVVVSELIDGEGGRATGTSSLKRSWIILIMLGQCSIGEFSVGKLNIEGYDPSPVGGA